MISPHTQTHPHTRSLFISDASQSNAYACNICDCCTQSHHLIADADAYVVRNAHDLDANDTAICAVDIDSGRTSLNSNTPSSPVIRRRRHHQKIVDECCTTTPTTTMTTTTTALTAQQTHLKLAQHRKSLSESDLLDEIDNALVFSKGFLYAYGKFCVCVCVPKKKTNSVTHSWLFVSYPVYCVSFFFFNPLYVVTAVLLFFCYVFCIPIFSLKNHTNIAEVWPISKANV